MATLALCRKQLPVDAYIGAGAIRNCIWNHVHGYPRGQAGDVDVVYFDAAMAPGADAEFTRRLQAAQPATQWEVTNQAHVHLWYRDYFGQEVAPLATLAQAVASWPDTATAVAVRLRDDGQFDVVAPFGLDDLFELQLRWNPGRISRADFLARIQAKQWLAHWPRLRVLAN
ncbi:hypothetical protein SAMN05518865_111136 [Duganella sp. CF458]|nr:hypothetical protein SAMN05518865_111136 [Duganella sp. CF458]